MYHIVFPTIVDILLDKAVPQGGGKLLVCNWPTFKGSAKDTIDAYGNEALSSRGSWGLGRRTENPVPLSGKAQNEQVLAVT